MSFYNQSRKSYFVKKENIDTKTGMTPQEQIAEILNILPKMYERKDKLSDVMNDLGSYNIKDCEYNELTDENKKFIRHYYKDNIKPLLLRRL